MAPRLVWWVVPAFAWLSTPAVCLAQDAAPAPTIRAEAATLFAEGTRAFDAKDYRRAAEAFEAAYRIAPVTDVLWNAARAWHRAGEAAHAATLYARYLRDASGDAADRSAATAQLATLAPKLARIEIHGDGIEKLEVDDAPSVDRVVYVYRGTHTISAVVGGKAMRKNERVEAADDVSVVFDASSPSDPAPPPAVIGTAPPPRAVEPEPHRHGLSPWVFVGGATLTAIATGLTIASGVDTENALTTFQANPSSQNLSSGQDKQLRTNVLLGTSIGLGAATAVVGIWLVGWHRHGEAVVAAIGPTGGAVRWDF